MAPGTALMLLTAHVAAGWSVFLASGLALDHGDLADAVAGLRRKLRRYLESGLDASRVLGRAKSRMASRRRQEAMRAAMPDALRLISTSLASGSSPVQALGYAAEQTPAPLGDELQQVVWDLKAGKSFSNAMDVLRERTGGSEFAYLAVVLELQHDAGGSLGATLATVSSSLRQSAELREMLRTKTAQGRLSARIVTAMPVVLLGVLSVFSPGYIAQFFSSPLGVVLFVFAVVLEGVGVLMVRRSLAVDVSSGIGKGA